MRSSTPISIEQPLSREDRRCGGALSATAEDLPTASFAGQQETYLNVHGEAMLLESVKKCFASLFTPRATSYRVDMGFGHLDVALSVGVQKMVRADLASSGVIFTLDTESGFRDVVFLTAAYGLGENVVQGRVSARRVLCLQAHPAPRLPPADLEAAGQQRTAHGL